MKRAPYEMPQAHNGGDPTVAHGDPPLVLVSWDGRRPLLNNLLIDGPCRFDLLVADYSGGHPDVQTPVRMEVQGITIQVVGRRTECKGDLYALLADHLAAQGLRPRHVGLIDDDVVLGVSDINRLLHLAHWHGLHCCTPSLSHDSPHTHRWMLHQPHHFLRPVDWVEVMMPFYSGELFEQIAPRLGGNISSWGIDRYLVPTLQALHGLPGAWIVDAVMAQHARDITSGHKVFRNGLTADQEQQRMRLACLELIEQMNPAFKSTPLFRRLFEQRHVRSRWEQLKAGLGRPIRRWLDAST